MFIAFLSIVVVALGAVSGDRRAEVVKVMEKNNFSERCRQEGKNEDDCIKDVKRYCGIQHVGNAKLTDELMGCVRKPKCGLPLLPSSKRNVSTTGLPMLTSMKQNGPNQDIAKFTKKVITYVLLNKGTNNQLTLAETQKAIDLSFEVWKCYTNLQYKNVKEPKDADIVFKFTPYYHGFVHYFTKKYIQKGYHFDGRGGVLAHAFLPFKTASNKGNLHYDDDELWIENHKKGIKLFHTTVHELGHALGLPHTPDRGNIMYGAYDDSHHETELDLGPYDKYEIQLRYGARQCTRKIWQEHYKRKYPEGDPSKNVCIDKYPCARKYPKKQCTHPRLKDWMSKNCRVFCGLCTPGNGRKNTRNPVNKNGECVDKVSVCAKYKKAMCTTQSRQHREWMSKNCRAFCGFCTPGQSAYNNVTKNEAEDEVCAASRIHGAFRGQNGDLYLIINGNMYKRDASSKRVDPQFKKKIADLWDSRLSRPSAAAYKASTDTMYLFQGRELFVVTGPNSDDTKTTVVKLPKAVSNPVAAFVGRYKGQDVINIYHDRKFSAVTVKNHGIKILKTQPFEGMFDTGNYPDRIPATVDSAFQDDDKVFFLTGSSVTIGYRDGDRYTLPSNMQPFMTDYLKCPQVL